MVKTDKPERVSLSQEEADGLKARINSNALLLEADKKIVLGLISFNFWLQQQLASAKLTIGRLRSLFGSPSTEKKSLKKTTL